MGAFDYEIKETIAVSARSVVRRAVRKSDGLPLVVKAPAQEYPASTDIWQFEFEYRLLRKLNVPCVVRALGLERSAHSVALLLEDFGGENVSISGRGLPLDTFFRVAIQAARGLGQIHDSNVIHKDVKPRNLLLNPKTGELKFIDFHLASELTSERQEVNALSQIQGSLPYISPEQTGRMNRELDYRSDYYSLGVTLFELCTGQLPFQAADAMGFVHAHLSRRAPSVTQLRPEVPLMVAEILAKLLAKDPDERYQSSHGLVADLERCQEQWQATGAVAPFTPGARDVSERFATPQKLFGRAEELSELFEAFKETCAGNSRLLLVSGQSGVGKTSLIQELQRPVVRSNGAFLSGKFDQLERNVPYGAFSQALRRMVRQLLFESDERLADLRRSLAAALGTNAQLMVDLIPELSQILGPQPEVPALGPTETKHRFRRVFREFIRVFARAEHPLVIFVDDLQWMDASTPELLTELFTGNDVRHLLVIGSYRDNEVKEGHLLSSCLRSLRERRRDVIRELALHPLSEQDVNALVAETLRSDPTETAPLTRVLYEKTEGNPLYVNELLASLHRAGAFVFLGVQGRWSYDLTRVQNAAVSESVAELMVSRLEKLPESSLAVLTSAACIGMQFELTLLAELSGASVADTAEALWEAIVQRIVVPLDGNYRLMHASAGADQLGDLGVKYQFQHDRVHRAVYSLLPEAERTRLHITLGRLLAGRAQADIDIFEIVNHYERGSALIQPSERLQLVELNARAGLKAKQSAAYAIAARQYERCIEHARVSEALPPAQRFEIHRQRVECTFLSGEVERAGALCESLFALATSNLERGAVYVLKTRIVEHQGKLLEAVATIRAGLRLFGVELPESHADIDRGIGEGIGKMQAHLARVPVEELARLPELVDPERVMTLNLLFQVIPPAIQTYPPLFILAELTMFDLALCHGVTDVSCKNFVDCGIIQGGILGSYDVAYRLGRAAFELLERYRPTPLESSVHFVFGAFVSQFTKPFREGLEAYERATRAGLELGDIQHAAYATTHRSHRSFLVGTNLGKCEREAREGIAFLEGVRAAGQLVGMLVVTRSLARLRATDSIQSNGGRTDEEAIETLRSANNAQWLFSFGQAQTFVSYVLRDWESAARWQAFTEPFEPAGVCLFSQPDYHLFRALLELERVQTASGEERERAWGRITEGAGKLAIWAGGCAENFAHKSSLLSAEIARAKGDPADRVLAHYEDAIEAAGEDFVPFTALTFELQSRYLASLGRERLSKLSMREAYKLYESWGAEAKLRQLETEFPLLSSGLRAAPLRAVQTETRTTSSVSSLDLTSVLKATHAISSEVRPDRLFQTLMEAIIENAGAERGCLILRNETDRRYHVEAWAAVDPTLASALRPGPLDSASHVCRDIVRYVIRTRESVVLDDAAGSGAFESDQYIQKHGVRSLLCIPVLNQGNLVAVLYAENNATRNAFTKDRIEILSVIASQAAISITNALLYESLERRVAERTLELAEKNREMLAMLNGMDQGIFTIDDELLIQPQYSRHLEQILDTTCLAGQAMMPLVFRGARLRADQLAAMETGLRFSFGIPPVLAEVNLEHAVRTFETETPKGEHRFFEVDWNVIVDDRDRVKKILVALRDVTMLRQLKEVAQRRERETDIVGQILDSGLEAFREFAHSATRLLGECKAILTAAPAPDPEQLRTIFRNLHTVKGNARLFGYSHMVDVVHEVEDVYGELRSGETGQGDAGALLVDIERLFRSLEEYQQICERKLRPLVQSGDARLEQAAREIHGLLQTSDAFSHAGEVLDRIKGSLERLRAVSLTQLVKETSRMFPSLASELSKSVPLVECQDRGAVLSYPWAEVMREVLVHSFRNAMAHGIEPRDERTALGKAPQGTLRLRTEHTDRGISVRLSDDGRGLAVEELRRRLGQAEAADEEIAEAVFSAGISTSPTVSKISGRGVGMDVIRSSVRKMGGDVRITFTGREAKGHRPFELVVFIPPAAMLS